VRLLQHVFKEYKPFLNEIDYPDGVVATVLPPVAVVGANLKNMLGIASSGIGKRAYTEVMHKYKISKTSIEVANRGSRSG